MEEPELWICLFFIYDLLRNGVYLVKKFKNIVSVNKCKGIILSFIRPKENLFAIHDAKCIKLLTSLRLNFSHLNEHKFRHSFRDIVDLICRCGLETETTLHFLLHCRLHSTLYIYIYIYMIISLHFTSRKIYTTKNTQTNKITRSPDTNIPESTWEYKITNNDNKYICKTEHWRL